jgi:carbohydrate-selective porin OprB
VNTDEQVAAWEEAVRDGTGGDGDAFVGRNQAYEAYVTDQLRRFNLA